MAGAVNQVPAGVPTCEVLESGVALIRLGAADERVVSLTEARIAGLKSILEGLRATPPKGLIIAGPSAEMFTVGADVNAIQGITSANIGESLAKAGQAVFDMIATLPVTTVAAMSGPCVGGGCELVLACSVRLISDQPSSSIGLPETKLGILPGFGGTQRLPRLIGLPRALDIILSGKILRPKQALKVGLVHEILPFPTLLARAEALARSDGRSGNAVRKPKIPLRDRLLSFNPIGRSIVRGQAIKSMARESKGFYPAPPAALAACLYGLRHGQRAGLDFEAKELGRLVVTPECRSLVRLFMLTESSKALGKGARKVLEHLQALVIGAGAMGAGIAGGLAKAECGVILKDTTEPAIQRGMEHIRGALSKLRYLSEQERSFILNRIEPTTKDSANLSSVNFVIEAVPEELALKQKILGSVLSQVHPESIIATNTSSLSVTQIAAGISHPERVVGMHFFNPVEKMPLVEIVRGKLTSDKVLAIVAALTVKLGKFPICVTDVPGFLVNRILSPYLNEAAFMVGEGYRVEDIDGAALAFGMPMGPIRLLDEVGLDVAAHVAESMIAGYGDRMSGPGFAKTLVAAGRKGRKNKAGFYDFSEERPVVFAGLRELLKIQVPERRDVDRAALSRRLVLTLINEAVRCLDEGVAGAPSKEAAEQVDLGSVMGFGFPPFRGGILYYAESLGAKTIFDELQKLEANYGKRFAPAEGIAKRAGKKASFLAAMPGK